mgnify:CR=1 FL=1
MQNEEKIELFEYIPVSKSVIKLALPMILSSLTVIIYNMADTFFVGMLADPIQNAAITLAAPIMLAFNVISNLLGVGTASMIIKQLSKVLLLVFMALYFQDYYFSLFIRFSNSQSWNLWESKSIQSLLQISICFGL